MFKVIIIMLIVFAAICIYKGDQAAEDDKREKDYDETVF